MMSVNSPSNIKNLFAPTGNCPDVDDLKNRIDLLDAGSYCMTFDDRIFFVYKSSKVETSCFGLVDLSKKSFAKGGFGKVYHVQAIGADVKLVFKLSRNKIKNRKDEVITTKERQRREDNGTLLGMEAKMELTKEVRMMQFIMNNAPNKTGLCCEVFAVTPYKNQLGVIVREFDCNGVDLLDDNPSIASRYSFMKQLFDGLRTLHEMNICHRDLKLENILINTKNGIAVIADFGNACHFNSFFTSTDPYPKYEDLLGRGTKGATSSLIVKEIMSNLRVITLFPFGTDKYIEIASKIKQLLKCSDCFSMGLLYYGLSTGWLPPFQSIENNQFLDFDPESTADEQHQLIEEMSCKVSQVFSYLAKDEADRAVEMVMNNVKMGLRFQGENLNDCKERLYNWIYK